MKFWNIIPGWDVGEFVGGAAAPAEAQAAGTEADPAIPAPGLDGADGAVQYADIELKQFIQERENALRAEESGETPGAETADAKPAAEATTAEKPAAEKPAEAARDAYGKTADDYAELGREWDQTFRQDKARAAAILLSAMTPKQQAAALEAAGLEAVSKQPSAVSKPDESALNFEVTDADREHFLRTTGNHLTDQEIMIEKNRAGFENLAKTAQALEASREWMTQGPQRVQEMVTEALGLVDEAYMPHVLGAEIAAARLDYALEALGLQLPTADEAAIVTAMQAGKTLREAVRETLAPEGKKAVERYQQRNAERPATPGADATKYALPQNAGLFDFIEEIRAGR